MKKPGITVPIDMRLDEPWPLQRQLRDRLREAVVLGKLPCGTRLPPSRALALRLGVSRNTVLFAYEELAADRILSGKTGSGTRVERGSRAVRFSDPDGLTFEGLGLL